MLVPTHAVAATANKNPSSSSNTKLGNTSSSDPAEVKRTVADSAGMWALGSATSGSGTLSPGSTEESDIETVQVPILQLRLQSNSKSQKAAVTKEQPHNHVGINILIDDSSSKRHRDGTDKKISRLQRKTKRHKQQLRDLSRSFKVTKRAKESCHDLTLKPSNPQRKITAKRFLLGLIVSAASFYLLHNASTVTSERLVLAHFKHRETVDRDALKQIVQHNNFIASIMTGLVCLTLVEIERLIF